MANYQNDFYLPLMNGEFDAHLDDILNAVQFRKRALAPTAEMFLEGEQIRLNNKVSPQYMRGVTAVIKRVNRTRVVVDLDMPRGRFHRNITVPLAVIEKIS